MSTKGGLAFLISAIILVLICIIGLIGVYYFDWLKPAKSNYSLYTTTGDKDPRFVIKDNQADETNPVNAANETSMSNQSDSQTNTVLSDAVIPDERYISTSTVGSSANELTFYELNTPKQTVSEEQQYTAAKQTNAKAADDTKQVRYSNAQTANVAAAANNQTYTITKQIVNLPKESPADRNAVQTRQESKPDNSVAKSQPTQTAADNRSVRAQAPANAATGRTAVKEQSSPAVTNNTGIAKTNNRITQNPVKPQTQTVFTKAVPVGKDGSPINFGFTFDKERDFHSYGQYISADEYKYRLAVINNLKIKTIVIDAVSAGNGISQEYYKVAYNEKMIPAKILDEIITSKEFRSLIPKQYLDIENKLAKFPKDGKVSFNNNDIKQLLILWSQGKLTPTQKAWSVNATL